MTAIEAHGSAGTHGSGHVLDGAFTSPLPILRMDRVERNIVRMQQWCREHRVELAPHAKTTLAPALLRRQLHAGAWGLTVANAGQGRIAIEAGAQTVLIANEVVDPTAIRHLATFIGSGVRMICYVDSQEGVAILEDTLKDVDPTSRAPLDVLVEMGIPGARGGVRDIGEAVAVAATAAAASNLRLVGVGGYEGVIPSREAADSLERVRKFLQGMVACGERLVKMGLLHGTTQDPAILTAGGSLFFDEVATVLAPEQGALQVPTLTVVRPGCYVTHDDGLYGRLSPNVQRGRGPILEAALEVWGRVLSRPEPSRLIVDVGRRNASYDHELPRPLWHRGASGEVSPFDGEVSSLSDQHALVDVAETTSLAVVGDWIGFGISHPCTTFDKWRVMFGVDELWQLTEEVDTCF